MISIKEEIDKLDAREARIAVDQEHKRIVAAAYTPYGSCQDGSCGCCDYCVGKDQ